MTGPPPLCRGDFLSRPVKTERNFPAITIVEMRLRTIGRQCPDVLTSLDIGPDMLIAGSRDDNRAGVQGVVEFTGKPPIGWILNP
ncbi:hypothetical protein [Kribbella sp. CA-294648]|uniref:hypothetical protein n=1 Tax=Kribbella sp. CA-294648 TaxID=3239948 RepID=UPI003D8E50C2